VVERRGKGGKEETEPGYLYTTNAWLSEWFESRGHQIHQKREVAEGLTTYGPTLTSVPNPVSETFSDLSETDLIRYKTGSVEHWAPRPSAGGVGVRPLCWMYPPEY